MFRFAFRLRVYFYVVDHNYFQDVVLVRKADLVEMVSVMLAYLYA